jgi:hypothetical protein
MIKEVDGKWCLYTKDGSKKLGCHDTKADAEAQERAIESNKNARSARCVRLLLAATGSIRTATFQEREHLVVPVVMLVEGVIHPVNAPTPELVLAEELAKSPQGWNGRPVLPDHPAIGGEKVSANDPRILEAQAFGLVFNAHMEGKQLVGEAWLDSSRASRVGARAVNVIERIRNAQMVEVSVGTFVVTEDKSGVYGGKQYKGIWREIVPDHMAMLEEGVEGACSIEMGCGAPRAATRYIISATGYVAANPEDSSMPIEPSGEKKPAKTFREKVGEAWGLLRFRGAKDDHDMSDEELRHKLDAALFGIEPAYMGVVAVFSSESEVIYAVNPEGSEQFFKRSYGLSDSGEVSLDKKKEEVRMETTFKPLMAASGCGCGENTGGEMKDRKERIKALIENDATPWKAEDQAYLEKLPEDRFEAHATLVEKKEPMAEEKAAAEAKTQADAKAEAEAKAAAAAKPVTEEEWLKGAPESIRTVIENHKKDVQAKHTRLLASLKDATKGIYSEDELKAKSVEELERIARLAQAEVPEIDYSGKALPNEDTEQVAEAPSLVESIRVSRKAS